MSERICLICGSNSTRAQYGYPKWHSYKDGCICSRCYSKTVTNPKRNPLRSKKMITYKGKLLVLDKELRKGKCECCGKSIGDVYIDSLYELNTVKLTHLHHIKYNDNDVLEDTIELCLSCHMIETKRIKKRTHKIHFILQNFIWYPLFFNQLS